MLKKSCCVELKIARDFERVHGGRAGALGVFIGDGDALHSTGEVKVTVKS